MAMMNSDTSEKTDSDGSAADEDAPAAIEAEVVDTESFVSVSETPVPQAASAPAPESTVPVAARKKSPAGWIIGGVLAVLAAAAAVQLTGVCDLLGLIRGLFG